MQQMMRMRGLMVRGAIWVGVTAVVATSVAALAQISVQGPQDPNQKQVFLVRKDVSESSGSDVPNVDPPLAGGNAVVTRLTDGTTSAKVAMTAKPSDILVLSQMRSGAREHNDGRGYLCVPDEFCREWYAFEMHSEGAPPGDRHQSAQVAF
jgi:hypothetical protein